MNPWVESRDREPCDMVWIEIEIEWNEWMKAKVFKYGSFALHVIASVTVTQINNGGTNEDAD